MTSVEPRTVIVTGAAGGIGLASARLFAEEGARVLLVDIDARVADEARALAEDGSVARGLVADVTEADAVDQIALTALEWSGKVDVLVNNAAIHRRYDSIELVPDSEWHRTMTVNLGAMFLLVRRLKPTLAAARGTVVNVSSIVGPVIGSTVSLPYAASKAAIVGLTRSLALEFAPVGVRVNCVCPGPIDTDLTRRSMGADERGEREALCALRQSVPLGRLGTASEVAAAIHFLASPAASFITGAALVIDGGLSVR